MPYQYNRTKREIRVVQPKKVKQTETYTTDIKCCDRELRLAHLSDTTSWKNDITSAWSKLYEATDVCEFELQKDGVATTYQPTLVQCVNDELAFYVTINWRDVLASDGIGCYDLILTETLLGETTVNTWGEYELKPYTSENAQGTIRLKAIFNQYHKIEDIDFTNSNVPDDTRIRGLFGERQPNTVIDNLTYKDLVERNVKRENLNVYTLKTDPIKQKIGDRFIDLYFLSETEMFLSDYNDFNYSNSYLDTPVTLKETSQPEYKDGSKFAVIKASFVDRKKDAFSNYNG